MAEKSLAVKYRPKSFDDVVEQGSIKTILKQQLADGSFKNAYLFCGGAGTGKTTCARIFANEINQHKGNPIEMDAASNSSVDDVREISQQAKTKSIESEYKVFIIDEAHSISNTGWQAFLKLLEEPPAKSIFIFCTTDPQKIPKTILSRVQRYDFSRISFDSVTTRLQFILNAEGHTTYEEDAVKYIAKIADGGMRDAITLMDKCLSYNPDLTIAHVIDALGTIDYSVMINLAGYIMLSPNPKEVLEIIEGVHRQGKDLKQFVRSFMTFVLDINKYYCTKSLEFTTIPQLYESDIRALSESDLCLDLLDTVIKLNADVKWDTAPKALIEATLLVLCGGKNDRTD